MQRRGIIWIHGHGGSEREKPSPPDVDPEVIQAREAYRRAEAEFYARQVELREAIARANGRKRE